MEIKFDPYKDAINRLKHGLSLAVTADMDLAAALIQRDDRSGDGVAFMHGIHGSDHHMIAFAKSSGPGLHHLSWDVGSVHEVGLGAMQMADRGSSLGWGMGRHVLGSNYFHYVRDPWGSYAEYSSDIDYIPVDCDWDSGMRSPDDAFYVWGPVPPQDFVHNYEVA